MGSKKCVPLKERSGVQQAFFSAFCKALIHFVASSYLCNLTAIDQIATLCHARSQLPDRLAGCSGPACKSAQPMTKLAKVGQKLSANQLAGIFMIRPYRTPIRLTSTRYARYGKAPG